MLGCFELFCFAKLECNLYNSLYYYTHTPCTVPCKTPYLMHGTLYEQSKGLIFQDVVKHSKRIELKCSKGYVLKHPALNGSLSCWHGEWDVEEPPECVPGLSQFPKIYVTVHKIVLHNAQLYFQDLVSFRNLIMALTPQDTNLEWLCCMEHL